MTDLKQAAQMALEALECCRVHYGQEVTMSFDEGCVDNAINALRTALEQQVEPGAWRTFDGEGGYDYRTYEDNEDYAAEWAKRNPRHVGWVDPLYTTPPQRKPLTDEEIKEAAPAYAVDDFLDFNAGVRFAEAAHGIKEGT